MQTAIHNLGWAVQRLALALGIIVFVALFAYAILVVAIVVGQAATAF